MPAKNLERYGETVGLPHLTQQLKTELELTVLESIAIPEDRKRMSDYCRADANLCERLVKLNVANRGRGLCPMVESYANVLPGDSGYGEFAETCARTPPTKLACVMYSNADPERRTCLTQVRSLLPR